MKGTLLLVLLGCLLIATAACAGPVVYLDQFGKGVVIDNPAVTDALSALNALAGGPQRTLSALGLTSAVPRGTKVIDFAIEDNTAIVNFTSRLTAGLDEARVSAIFEQVKYTLWYYGIEVDISILVDGTPLSDFLPPTPNVVPKSATEDGGGSISSLSGRSITLSPGHGWFWNGSGSVYPATCLLRASEPGGHAQPSDDPLSGEAPSG